MSSGDYPFNAPLPTPISPAPPAPVNATTVTSTDRITVGTNLYVENGNVYLGSTSSYIFGNSLSNVAVVVPETSAINLTVGGSNLQLTYDALSDTFGTLTANFTHVNATPTTPALPANPPVSGTVYQNTTGGPINIIIPITATAIGGSGQLALGPTTTPPDWGGAEQIGVSGEVHNVSLRVPNDWYWSITVASATIGTANVWGE